MLDLMDRKTLIASLPKNSICAEIGVSHGLFSKYILEVSKPSLLYLIDAWTHQSEEVIGNDPSNAGQEQMDVIYEQVKMQFANDPRVAIVKMFSSDAVKEFEDGYLDWAYIDANHLLARQDAELWWQKIASGGYLMGHDYTNAGDCIRVKRDIDAWAEDNGIRLEIAGLESDDIYERNYPTWIARKP